MKVQKMIHGVARVVPAVLLLQTLFFKFTAHPQSVELFTKIGMEPTGRIGSGIVELIAGLLLLFGGKWVTLGAVLATILMLGAIYFHITILGIDQLFWMALIVLLGSLYTIYTTRKSCPMLGQCAQKK